MQTVGHHLMEHRNKTNPETQTNNTMISKYTLSSGELGCIMESPEGTPILTDDEELKDALVVVDKDRKLTWAVRFFENLHMDLRESMRRHLEEGIEKQTRALFEETFWNNFKANTTIMKPMTQENNWSPVIDLDYKDVTTISNTSCPALLVVYRKACRPGEEIVVGRFCLPLYKGLLEVEIEAVDQGQAWRGATGVSRLCHDELVRTENLQAALKSDELDLLQYEDQGPSHCLSRVRMALKWLTKESRLLVTQPPQIYSHTADIMLPHLECALKPPPRFIYCPNLLNPESSKQRFYRATLGSVGVQMLVVSVWYTDSYAPHLRTGGNASLSKIAHHGALSIHRAQNFRNINVTVQGTPVSRRKSWLGGTGNKDAVITIVDCEEAGGVKCENTIGWIRTPNSDAIYLIYYADTLRIDQNEVRTELLDCLFSLRTVTGRSHSGRRRSSRSLWNVTNQAISGEASSS